MLKYNVNFVKCLFWCYVIQHFHYLGTYVDSFLGELFGLVIEWGGYQYEVHLCTNKAFVTFFSASDKTKA